MKQFHDSTKMKSIRDSTPRLTTRGKPYKRATEAGTPVVTRLQKDMLRALDRWMIEHDLVSRPEAIRQILKDALGKYIR